MAPNGFASWANIDIVHSRNRHDHMRHAAIDEMHSFFRAPGNEFDAELQIFWFTHLQRDRFTVQFAANQTGRRLK